MAESAHPVFGVIERLRYVVRQNCLAAIDVFVLAGGLGTRIRPVLGDTPKIAGPDRWAALSRLSARLAANASAHGGSCSGLGHRAQAPSSITLKTRNRRPDLEITTVVEPSPLGTAGAIRFARGAICGAIRSWC